MDAPDASLGHRRAPDLPPSQSGSSTPEKARSCMSGKCHSSESDVAEGLASSGAKPLPAAALYHNVLLDLVRASVDLQASCGFQYPLPIDRRPRLHQNQRRLSRHARLHHPRRSRLKPPRHKPCARHPRRRLPRPEQQQGSGRCQSLRRPNDRRQGAHPRDAAVFYKVSQLVLLSCACARVWHRPRRLKSGFVCS